MSEFKVGDYVQVVEMRGEGAEDYHERRADYLGMVGRITDISGADYPYSVEFGGEVSYHWFNADELTAIAPATAPTAAAQGEVCRCGYPMADHDVDGECPGDGYTGQRSPDQILTPTELVHLWREMKADPHDIHKQLAYFKSLADTRLTDGYKFIDERNALAAERASLEAALQQAQRERDAANELLAKIERRMPMVQPFDLGVHYYSETYNAWLVGDWIRAYQKAASAQQAAQPADGEG